MKKIMILGGHGFVGSWVNRFLKQKGEKPVSLSRRSGLDLLDFASTKHWLKKINPEVIINCAIHGGSVHYVSEFAADVVHDNLQMTLNLYRAVKNLKIDPMIINPISNCAYPGLANIQKESAFWDGPVHPSVWSIANAKRAILVISQCYASQYQIKTINYLVPNSYGPGDYLDPNKTHALNGMIIRMLKAKAENQPEFEIWGTGKPKREWIYVKDLARLLVMALRANNPQIEPINLAQNKAYSIAKTAKIIMKLTGYKGKLVFNPKYQDGAMIKKLDDTLFRKKYPRFKFTPIGKGIKETIAYYLTKL